MDAAPPLSQGWGYAVCLGFGAAFSIVTTLLVFLDAKYAGTSISSEQFNTAGRTVKTGLVAAVVCSQWTWAATLLQSSNVAWMYGVSGPYWYGAGACVQILLFGILSIEIKRKAPRAHTVCEIIRARWGGGAHQVFLFFCLLTNMLVTAMLLLGGAATITAITGMPTMLAAFLIPLGIITYTFADGLKATFLSNYLHTVILHAVLIVFVAIVYLSPHNPVGGLGSIERMYERLVELTAFSTQQCHDMGLVACGPVAGNAGGSYLTMLSSGGAMFAAINVVGNFGTVFVDQSYWQSAIAARPSAAVRGYLLGGFCWFAIPFALATSLGLACLALRIPITAAQADAGLVPVLAAVSLLGPGGGFLILLMVFMAVTSCGSAELIAVSSLLTYDVYRTYINPDASGHKLLRVSRGCVAGFGLFMGCLAAALQAMGLELGYVYLLMGALVGSAVAPISSCLLWSKASAKGAITAALVGQVLAVASWLVTAKVMYGSLSLASTGKSVPMLVGNLVALLASSAILLGWGLLWPDSYDWEGTRSLAAIAEESVHHGGVLQEEGKAEGEDAKAAASGTAAAMVVAGAEEEDEEELRRIEAEECDPVRLKAAQAMVMRWGVGGTLVLMLIWPLSALPVGSPFPLGYFGLWVSLGIGWGLVSSAIITTLPLLESRQAIGKVLAGLAGSLSGGKGGKKEEVVEVSSTRHTDASSSTGAELKA